MKGAVPFVRERRSCHSSVKGARHSSVKGVRAGAHVSIPYVALNPAGEFRRRRGSSVTWVIYSEVSFMSHEFEILARLKRLLTVNESTCERFGADE